MSDADAQPQELDEILRLVTALAEQLLASGNSERSISPERLRVMVSAAQFLHDNDVPWSPAVQKILNEIAGQREARHGH